MLEGPANKKITLIDKKMNANNCYYIEITRNYRFKNVVFKILLLLLFF